MGVLFYNPAPEPESDKEASPSIKWDIPNKKPLEINCGLLWARRAPGIENFYL
ncbi:hypothetical protein K435DRAFT_787611 [Dendrothele bispora CBS 962.96]|uniref:Uncharacterized protein n=1 Tax=Dendrothele bispora (strain CBS 962.96) TaxID=1314807 RepID=A0A4S8KIT7_DENBC|nr:hypothetical protein K435DRAFT_787611 [Dendrothele bispora CBS 962.96]